MLLLSDKWNSKIILHKFYNYYYSVINTSKSLNLLMQINYFQFIESVCVQVSNGWYDQNINYNNIIEKSSISDRNNSLHKLQGVWQSTVKFTHEFLQHWWAILFVVQLVSEVLVQSSLFLQSTLTCFMCIIIITSYWKSQLQHQHYMIWWFNTSSLTTNS